MLNPMNKLTSRLEQIRMLSDFEDKIFIYQMGKVGSTSLEKSIKNSVHWHSFYPFFNRRIYNSSYNKIKLPTRIVAPVEYFMIRNLFKMKVKSGNKLKIITLVREPISRNISFLFQFAPIFLYKIYFEKGNRANVDKTLELLEEEFYERLWHTSANEWFDQDFKEVTGIDIFDHDFDQTKGYAVIEENNISVLVLKMEQLNENIEVIGEFIGDDHFEIVRDNMGSEKWYADLYRTFKKNFRPKEDYVDALYQSRYMKHFYSPQEIQAFRRKWLGG